MERNFLKSLGVLLFILALGLKPLAQSQDHPFCSLEPGEDFVAFDYEAFEAYSKQRGGRLSTGIAGCEVSLNSGNPIAFQGDVWLEQEIVPESGCWSSG